MRNPDRIIDGTIVPGAEFTIRGTYYIHRKKVR